MIPRSFGLAFHLQLAMYIPLYIDCMFTFKYNSGSFNLHSIQLCASQTVFVLHIRSGSLVLTFCFLILFWTPFSSTWRNRTFCSTLADADLTSTAPLWMSPPKETDFSYLFESVLKLSKRTRSLAVSKHRWFTVEEANRSCIFDYQPRKNRSRSL